MQRPEMSANSQVLTAAIMVGIFVAVVGQNDIPISLAGPFATVLVVILSIVTRWGLFRTLKNTGPDLAFCSVGLQLALLYKKLEQSAPLPQSYMGWDIIFLLAFLIFWMGSLILVRNTPRVRRRLGRLNPSSLGATILGVLSIVLQIYLRMSYRL